MHTCLRLLEAACTGCHSGWCGCRRMHRTSAAVCATGALAGACYRRLALPATHAAGAPAKEDRTAPALPPARCLVAYATGGPKGACYRRPALQLPAAQAGRCPCYRGTAPALSPARSLVASATGAEAGACYRRPAGAPLLQEHRTGAAADMQPGGVCYRRTSRRLLRGGRPVPVRCSCTCYLL